MTDYYPFGEIHLDQTTTAYKNPYKFTGKELDADTGLYYYGARYYNAALGRFISQDPWEGDYTDPQTLNKYSYVMNNPLRYIDPTGKFALAVFWDSLGEKLPSNTVCVGCGSTQNDSKSVNYGKIGSLPEPTSGEKTMYMILGGLATGGLAPEIEEASSIISGLVKNNNTPGDYIKNPQKLNGKTPADILETVKNDGDSNWEVGTLNKGSKKGEGLVLREVKEGKYTSRNLQWHPGGGHHGPDPYWKVSSPEGGIQRVGPQFGISKSTLINKFKIWKK